MAKKLNVALLGYQFMGKAHSNAFRQVSRYFPEIGAEPVLKCLVGRNRDAVTAAAAEYGFEEVDTNWRRAVNRDDIDVVDICTECTATLQVWSAALDVSFQQVVRF